jgi:hypothetical protein
MKTRALTMWACLLLACFALDAHAGIMSPCSDPTVLPGPKVAVYILPYTADSQLTTRGRELATVVQRHVLYAALKYPSIAVAELTGNANECGVDRITQRVLGKLKSGQSAIFLWGRMFEQADAIYLQSTVMFAMRGATDTLEWTVTSDTTGATRASIPTTPVSFTPRRIPLYFLTMLEPAQREARRLHREPNTTSQYFDLPADPEARFGYEVLESRDDWMHVRIFGAGGGGDSGWIPAHALASGEELKGAFPELYFVDGLIGYHTLWRPKVTAAVGATLPGNPSTARILGATRISFDRYLSESTGRAEADARALAAVLEGNATLRASNENPWSVAILQSAETDYEKARGFAPMSTVAGNFFLACGSALCARGACTQGADRLHEQYLAAISRDPTSTELVGNLAVFYDAAQGGRIKVATPPAALEEQRVLTRSAAEAMK